MRTSLATLLGGAAVVLALPVTTAAQSASITARADVAVALTATAGDSLRFGAVFPNTTRTILPTDAASGSFSLAGAAGAEVSVTFTLPASLTDGVNNLAVTFGANAGSRNTANARAGSTTFNPAAALVANLDGTTGNLYLFIGGAVSPTTEPNGTYVGTVQLTAAYTGN